VNATYREGKVFATVHALAVYQRKNICSRQNIQDLKLKNAFSLPL
jgi:hypothetical protein